MPKAGVLSEPDVPPALQAGLAPEPGVAPTLLPGPAPVPRTETEASDESKGRVGNSPIAAMFDRIHRRYDLLNHVLSLGLDVLWRRRAIRELGLRSGDRVVDLCCGTGDLSQEMARVVGPTGRVVGVDFAAGMLRRAREKYPTLEFIEGDALNVPLEGPFDAAALAFGPRNISDLQGLWRELRRLVRPGGTIMSLELTRPSGLLGWLHGLYLRHVLPRLGSLISGDSTAYTYLCNTIACFLDREQLSQSMRDGGLLEVRAVPLHLGIVTVHVARVP